MIGKKESPFKYLAKSLDDISDNEKKNTWIKLRVGDKHFEISKEKDVFLVQIIMKSD